MYQRYQAQILLSRLKEPVNRMIVITGPRQTGKTTLVTQALKSIYAPEEYKYVAIDEPTTQTPYAISQETVISTGDDAGKKGAEWLTQQWEEARKFAKQRLKNRKTGEPSKKSFILVLDEIQKIPQWSEIIKGLWDADRATRCPLHVVILGSAPLLMQKGLTESLAGRFELIRVSHWSFLEMHEAFDLDLPSYIYFGGYPGAIQDVDDQRRWADYVRSALIEPNIEKDIFMLTRVDKPALFKQLFELGCHYSGQELALTKMKGTLNNAGNETTLANYLNHLANAGLLVGLQKFANQEVRRRASVPKLNVLNTGLMTAVSGYTLEQARADRTFWGRLVESAVGAHLFNMGTPDIKLYYWREGVDEVDFIMERGNQRIAIEVKSGLNDTARSGLDIFKEKFQPHRTILVGDKGESLETFLSVPPLSWFD